MKNLAAQQTELGREEDALAQIQSHLYKLEQEILSTRQAALGLGAVGAHALLRLSDYLRGLANDSDTAHKALAAQELAVDYAKARLKQARDHLRVCRREEEMLTKVRNKLYQRFLESEARKEEIELDEIGNTVCLARIATL